MDTDKNSVFFGTDGLTSTSANHVANMAKEYAQKYEMGVLYNFEFFSTFVSLIGTDAKTKTKQGLDENELFSFQEYLNNVAKAKSLIAWLREAIKARDAMFEAIRKKDIEEWCNENGYKFWNTPARPEKVTKDDILAKMGVKDRNRIYELETKCAVLGKFIHPDSTLSNARKELTAIKNAPYEVKGEGRDALVYEYKPTVEPEKVERVFFELQAEHRATQAELNSILYDIESTVRSENLQAENEYLRKVREAELENKEVLSKFEIWKNEETRKVQDLKIVIPDHLKQIYELVNTLGK